MCPFEGKKKRFGKLTYEEKEMIPYNRLGRGWGGSEGGENLSPAAMEDWYLKHRRTCVDRRYFSKGGGHDRCKGKKERGLQQLTQAKEQLAKT